MPGAHALRFLKSPPTSEPPPPQAVCRRSGFPKTDAHSLIRAGERRRCPVGSIRREAAFCGCMSVTNNLLGSALVAKQRFYSISTFWQILFSGHTRPSLSSSQSGRCSLHHFSPILKAGSSSFPGKSGQSSRALSITSIFVSLPPCPQVPCGETPAPHVDPQQCRFCSIA